MSKITAGQVAVILGEQEVVLKPTLRAATTINNHFGNFSTALAQVQAMSLDAIVYVIRHGANLGDDKELKEKVWQRGVMQLMAPCVEYLMVLANGGRPLDEGNAADDEGNAEA